MATRSVIVRLEAQVAGYVAGLGRAASATDNVAKKAAQARKSVGDNEQAMKTAGAAYAAFGAAVVGGLAAAGKAAMDWESAWAGVQKTNNGTAAEMDALEASLRGLAKTLPASHAEIAGVAEAAGQLGIERKNVAAFTKTMIDLGESTNLSADEAATGLARFSNIMGTSQDEASNLGSTLVGLGNNFATTESEILAMSMRLAGTGAQLGLSEGEVMGLATAMSSVGIEAEAGGTAMSMGMKKIDSAVRDGGESLSTFASTAGLSADQFAKKWQDDPAAAMESFVQGLGKVKEEGGSVSGLLDELGIKGIREQDTFLRLAGAADIMGEAFAQGNEEFSKNSALIEEASKRYETTESRIKIAWNNIKDAGIDAGAAILPVVATLAEGAIGLANAFGAIPAPVQGGLTMLGGIVGVSALVAGGLLMVIPRVAETAKAFKDLNASGSKIPGVMGKIGKAAGIAAVGLVAFEAIKGVHNNVQPATASLEEFTQALIKMDDQKSALNDMFGGIDFGEGSRWAGEISDAGDALSELINQDMAGAVESFGSTVLGIDNGMSKMADAISKADQSIATAANSGNMDMAAEGFKSIAEAAEAQGVSLEDTFARFPEYEKALRDQAIAAEADVTEQEMLAWALGELPPAMQEAAEGAEEAAKSLEEEAAAAEEAARVSEEMAEALAEIGLTADGTIGQINKFAEALLNAGLVQLSANDASRNFEAAIDGVGTKVAELVEEHGSLNGILNETADGFNRDTEAGRAAEEAFDGVASAGSRLTQALAENGESNEVVQASLGSTYDSLIVAAGQMGIYGEEADTAARKVMGIPKEANIETWMSDSAKRMAEETTGAIDILPEQVNIDSWMSAAAKETADATKKSVDDIPNQETIDSWMSDAAFIEAVRTRAAAHGIPEQEVIDSFMSSAARNEADDTTSAVLGIPKGASITAYMEAYARIEAQNTKAAIDAIPKNVEVLITTRAHKINTETSDKGYSQNGGVGGLATGGRLPTTGPGTDRTDGILGVSKDTGAPLSWLDGGEHITSEAMTNKHSDLLWAIHKDDPRLSDLPGFARGGRRSGVAGLAGLAAQPGEENWQWQARQARIVESMESTVGKLADWEIHEDGSGWVQTMDGAILKIADGAMTAASTMGDSAERAHWAGETAKVAGLSFEGAGVSASATAGSFKLAGEVTKQAAQAILAATAAVNSAGQKRAPAQGGGVTAQAGEANAVWRGRQDQFEQSLSKQFGGVRYSDIHEDGSGQVILDDGRKIELNQGRWQFVSQFKYGAPSRGRTVSRYASGGRLPTTGPGTNQVDGILGVSGATGQPTAFVDAGEHITSRKMTEKHSGLLWAIHRDDPRLSSIPQLAGGGRASREYAAASHGYAPPSAAASGPMQMVGQLVMDSGEVMGTFRGVATQVADQRINAAARAASTIRRGM